MNTDTIDYSPTNQTLNMSGESITPPPTASGSIPPGTIAVLKTEPKYNSESPEERDAVWMLRGAARWHALYGLWVSETGQLYDPYTARGSSEPRMVDGCITTIPTGPDIPLHTWQNSNAVMTKVDVTYRLPNTGVEFVTSVKRSVSRIVLETWHGLAPDLVWATTRYYAGYHDGDTTNVHAANLYWRDRNSHTKETRSSIEITLSDIQQQLTALHAKLDRLLPPDNYSDNSSTP